MWKHCLTTILALFALNLVIAQDELPPFKIRDAVLQEEITHMDSLFFNAYNHCKPDVFEKLISDKIEFYHDQGGFSNTKSDLIRSLKENICGKVERELLQGSIEVYPIPAFGAVQMGVHRFHNLIEKSRSPYSRFIHIWKFDSGNWYLFRVMSFH